MSRNLGDRTCRICHDEVVLEELARPITEAETGPYHSEYRGMLVANAHCVTCDAKYLAWCVALASKRWGHFANPHDAPFFDLSFRAAFNDEPAPEDLPTPEVLQAMHARKCLAHAAECRERASIQAAVLLAEANDHEDRATKPSHWEAYRR